MLSWVRLTAAWRGRATSPRAAFAQRRIPPNHRGAGPVARGCKSRALAGRAPVRCPSDRPALARASPPGPWPRASYAFGAAVGRWAGVSTIYQSQWRSDETRLVTISLPPRDCAIGTRAAFCGCCMDRPPGRRSSSTRISRRTSLACRRTAASWSPARWR